MQIVQQLYEGVEIEGEGIQGLVTYIRTDSVRISDEAMDAVRAYIPERFGLEFLPQEKNEYKGRKNAQDAHEAIRPTRIDRTPDSIKSSLSREQYMLYRLIWNRFVASQMSAAVYQTLTADAWPCVSTASINPSPALRPSTRKAPMKMSIPSK